MARPLALLAAALLGMLGLSAVAAAQPQSAGSTVFEIVRPFLVEIASVVISGAVLWLVGTVKAKFNIEIEARHRDALQAALTNAAGLVINRAGGVAGALALPTRNPLIIEGVGYVVKSAPDALKHFGITPEAAGAVLSQKLEAKIGVMVASPTVRST